MEKQSVEKATIVAKGSGSRIPIAPEKTIKGEIVHIAFEKAFGLKRTHIVTLLDYEAGDRHKIYISSKQASEYQYTDLLRVGRKVSITVSLASKDNGYEQDGKIVAFEGTGNVFRSMSALSEFEYRQLKIKTDISTILSSEETNRRDIASYLGMVQ